MFCICLVQNCPSQEKNSETVCKSVLLGSETVCPEKDRQTAFYSPLHQCGCTAQSHTTTYKSTQLNLIEICFSACPTDVNDFLCENSYNIWAQHVIHLVLAILYRRRCFCWFYGMACLPWPITSIYCSQFKHLVSGWCAAILNSPGIQIDPIKYCNAYKHKC